MTDSLTEEQFLKLTYINTEGGLGDDGLPPRPEGRSIPDDGLVHDLAAFESMPPELLLPFLTQLDLRTLLNFRLLNRSAAAFVDSIPEFHAIATHAPNVLYYILRVEAGKYYTCGDLYRLLLTSDCVQCGNYGGYLQILSRRRLCERCWMTEENDVVNFDDAVDCYGLDQTTVWNLPHLRERPASDRSRNSRNSGVLFDQIALTAASVARHGDIGSAFLFAAQRQAQTTPGYHRLSLMERTQIVGDILSDHDDRREQDPHASCPAVVRLPTLDRATFQSRVGRRCVGCYYSWTLRLDVAREYITAGDFERHLAVDSRTVPPHHRDRHDQVIRAVMGGSGDAYDFIQQHPHRLDRLSS